MDGHYAVARARVGVPSEGGRYRLLKLIGEGGMGAVYKAEDTELGRLVAIKILHPALAMDEKYVRRLKREVRLASRVNHPNVVRVNDLGAIHGALMISMALVEGETLAVILKRQGPPPAARVESFFRQLCAALSAASTSWPGVSRISTALPSRITKILVSPATA